MDRKKIISVLGTTASGKSSVGVELALIFGGEIISADSRQVYRGLDLGSGKITREETKGIPHHLIDITDPAEIFSLALFQHMAYEAIDRMDSIPFIVGGTGLYMRSVTDGYMLSDAKPDNELRARLEEKSIEEILDFLIGHGADTAQINESERANKRRLIRMAERVSAGGTLHAQKEAKYDVLKLGITYEREILAKRIEERLDLRLKNGMVEEVEGLLAQGVSGEFLDSLGLEYRYIYRYILNGKQDFEMFRESLCTAIKRFSKRQMTWFRQEKDIVWLDMNADFLSQAAALVENFLYGKTLDKFL